MTENEKKQLNELLSDTSIVDPTEWIKDFENGVPVHEKITFIKALWSHVMKIDDNTSWIEEFIKNDAIRVKTPYMRQYPEIINALKSCTDKGVELNDINTIIREAQFTMLYHFVAIFDQNANYGIFSRKQEDYTLPDKDFGELQDDLEILNPEYDKEFDW